MIMGLLSKIKSELPDINSPRRDEYDQMMFKLQAKFRSMGSSSRSGFVSLVHGNKGQMITPGRKDVFVDSTPDRKLGNILKGLG